MNILITGATSGIGKQLATDYHKQKHQVWAVGRNESRGGKCSYPGWP